MTFSLERFSFGLIVSIELRAIMKQNRNNFASRRLISLTLSDSFIESLSSFGRDVGRRKLMNKDQLPSSRSFVLVGGGALAVKIMEFRLLAFARDEDSHS